MHWPVLERLYAGLPLDRFKKEQARLAYDTVEAKGALRASQTKFEKVQETIDKALTVSANLHDMYQRAAPQVRRIINQGLFDNLWVSTGLLGTLVSLARPSLSR